MSTATTSRAPCRTVAACALRGEEASMGRRYFHEPRDFLRFRSPLGNEGIAVSCDLRLSLALQLMLASVAMPRITRFDSGNGQ